MYITWIYFLWLLITVACNNIERATYCYGDNSAGSNIVDVSCTSGTVYINDVIAATKPTSLSCSPEDHIGNPAGQEKCCTYNETDCMKSWSGSWDAYRNCIGKMTCYGAPVIRDEPICSTGDFPRFSNYMILEYYCMPAGYIFGPCNSTADCNNPAAMCNETYCACQTGYTTFSAFDDCWRDGGLNGSCTGAVGCQDANTFCNFTSGRCQCDVGYIAFNGSCRQGGHNFGFCVDTADCTDPQALCDKSVCVCKGGYTAFAEFDDCWKDGGLNGSCTGSIGCHNNNTVCDTTSNRCACSTGYSAYNGLCYADGDLHGFCNTNDDCVDYNVECTNQRCECITGYRDMGGTCLEDGRLNGYCEASVIECVDDNTTCQTENGTCECVDGYTEIGDTCEKDGELGGVCVVDGNCTDTHAECVLLQSNPALSVCECKDGYTDIDGQCIEDGDLHGFCNTNDDCVDDNVECTNQRCECIAGYNDIGGTCRKDGHPKGYCDAVNITCVDNNSNCSNGICECFMGYTELDGECKKDGDLGGVCVVDGNCTDADAECVSLLSNPALSVCVCKGGYTDIDGQCIEDGTLNGICNGSVVCKDNNTECNTATKRCQCSSGYVPYDDICYGDGDLHGFCVQDSDCLDDNVECINQRCECITNYRDIDGQCLEDWHLNGFCEVTIDCVDENTECSEGICECIDGYTEIDGTCMKDWDIGGVCAVDSDCLDDNAQCVTMSSNTAISICECNTNYTNIEGECKQDRRLGGRCTNTASCLDTNTNCSTEGICTCIAQYSEVNDICKEDEKEGGVCGQSVQGGHVGQCTEDHTVCEVDTQLQCGGSKCTPGLCQCKQGFSIGFDSTCTKDGDIGGVCNMDSDCADANANCVGTPLFCTCSTGYRNVDGACVKDGDPGGFCLSGNMCTDSHSICVNGTCICNDVRDYVIKDGSCQRDDSYISGECEGGICFDSNAVCSGNKCMCKSGYSQHNGICTTGELSSVTSCNGSSPYNQLSPDCDQDSVPLIIEQYQRVKAASNNCSGNVSVYSDVIFMMCCSYDVGDCRLHGSEADACSPADLVGAYTTYNVIDYICAKADSVIDASTNDDVTSNQVYVTISTDNVGNTGKTMCSVTASCQTDISVYLVFLNFAKVNNQCSQTLTITEGTSSTTFDCDYTVENTTMAVYSTSAGFFTFRVTNPDQGGRFVLNIEAETTTADLLVACGSEADSEGPGSFGTCSPEAASKEEDKTNQTALLAVIIPVAILVVLAVAAILFWLFKDTIRKRCFPKQESALPVKPVIEGPTPMNVKYTGTGVPSDVKVPKAMPPPWLNSGWSPSNEKFHGNIPKDSNLRKTLPPIIRPQIGATPMNMKYSGKLPNGSGHLNEANYLHKEEVEADKNVNKKKQKKIKRNTISPINENDVLLANGAAGLANTANLKSKGKKKNKKLRKVQLGIKAKQAFELPTQLGNSQAGVYRPNQDFYNRSLSGMNHMNGTPAFSQSVPGPNMQNLKSPVGRLPPLQNTISNTFDPRASWRTTGSVVSVAVQPKVRRPSVIDIASVDDPSNIEHFELANN
ncbi:neurogenic locus Notch protein-like isoform X2 [Mercenaria mercenaria]|uniref:neurogenic locus Notch protein-like isoform X2 n=1 Tax=Mercenaria mercenaria TaxID=6596 RepID=UPI00234E40D2|nr:neurogenic locus Notch protein-like isoform X2 [Mercenaria mercenaria]